MEYCPVHERIWYPGGGKGQYDAQPGWEPLRLSRLALALKLAREAGCAGQVIYIQTPCDVCKEETHGYPP